MKLREIYEIADAAAPKRLSDEFCERYGAYDNSGILVDTGEEIKGALFSLDLSKRAIERAIALGANLIVTHHPAIYGKIDIIDGRDSALGEKLVRCIRNGVSVLSMHLNLDACEGGIDESFMEGICLSASKRTGAGLPSPKIFYPLTGGGYGRAYEIEPVSVKALAEGMKSVFQTERVEWYGDGEEKIRKVASFCGAGADEGSIAFAAEAGADAIVSSDFKHHLLLLALEKGLKILTLPHYASERYGFEKYYKKISQRLRVPCVYHVDEQLL